MTTQTDTDDSSLPPADPVRELAHDAATQSVPIDLDRLTFDEWCDAVDVVRGDLMATLEREVSSR